MIEIVIFFGLLVALLVLAGTGDRDHTDPAAVARYLRDQRMEEIRLAREARRQNLGIRARF